MTDLTHTFTVDATPQDVYAAIVDVRSWWGATNIVGPTDQVGADWFYLVPDIHYSKQHTAEQLVPGERVVWESHRRTPRLHRPEGRVDRDHRPLRHRPRRRADAGEVHPRGPDVDRRVLRRLP